MNYLGFNPDNLTETVKNRKDEKKAGIRQQKSPGIYPGVTMYGITAGLLMGIYLVFLQMLGMENSIGLKFLKHLILISVLGWGLYRYRKLNAGRTFFAHGIRFGALTTLIAAAALIVINILVSLVEPDWAFNKFNLAVDSPGSFLITSGAIFF